METPVVVAVALVALAGGVVLGIVVRTMVASQAIKAAQAAASSPKPGSSRRASS